MSYAFISYSSKNQSYANMIKEFLSKENISTWMAPGDIPPGSRYAAIITKALKECSCLVLILSNDSLNSVWVANEVERALNYKKTVIPVKIEEVTLNDEFDFYIGSSQIIAINKIDSQLPEVKLFLNSVKTLVGQDPAPITDDATQPPKEYTAPSPKTDDKASTEDPMNYYGSNVFFYHFDADISSVYEAYLKVIKEKFGRVLDTVPNREIRFKVPRSFRYNMNGGDCYVHLFLYKKKTAVGLFYKIAQLLGASCKAHAADMASLVEKELHTGAYTYTADRDTLLNGQSDN